MMVVDDAESTTWQRITSATASSKASVPEHWMLQVAAQPQCWSARRRTLVVAKIGPPVGPLRRPSPPSWQIGAKIVLGE